MSGRSAGTVAGMSTKITRALLSVPGTDFAVHVFRDCIDQRTYVGVGTWRREAIVQVPRFWLRYSKRGRSPEEVAADDPGIMTGYPYPHPGQGDNGAPMFREPCTCPPKIMLGEVPDCARHGRAPK
jgi:hypothetical protein